MKKFNNSTKAAALALAMGVATSAQTTEIQDLMAAYDDLRETLQSQLEKVDGIDVKEAMGRVFRDYPNNPIEAKSKIVAAKNTVIKEDSSSQQMKKSVEILNEMHREGRETSAHLQKVKDVFLEPSKGGKGLAVIEEGVDKTVVAFGDVQASLSELKGLISKGDRANIGKLMEEVAEDVQVLSEVVAKSKGGGKNELQASIETIKSIAEMKEAGTSLVKGQTVADIMNGIGGGLQESLDIAARAELIGDEDNSPSPS